MKPQLTAIFNAKHQPARVSFTMSEAAKDAQCRAIMRAHKAFIRNRLSVEQYRTIMARFEMITQLLNAPGFPVYHSVFTDREKQMARAGYVFTASRWSGNGDRREIRNLAGFRRDQLLFDNFAYDRDQSK